ncbi:hypothetical protein FQN50_002023 [Emmonsiellopsis sp. PD_5]|nr:hypothetical protein FQN50_002023 [Emmonsiellopsis sp. PD_5]
MPKAQKRGKQPHPCFESNSLTVQSVTSSGQPVVNVREPASNAQDTSASGSSLTQHTPTITLPPTLARTAYQDKYISLFWTAYTPGTQHISPPTLRNSLGSWTNAIHDLYLTDDVLRKALLAISLTTIGRGRDGEKWMVEQGLELYTGALKDMSATLAVGGRGRVWGKGKADALLTASKIFSLYETISALLARKKTPLSSPEWKTIPWLHHPKSLRDKLLDILVDIPTIYEEVDILNALSSRPTNVHRNSETQTKFNSLHHSLLTSCWALDSRLDEWYQGIPLPREEGIPTPNTGHPTFPRDTNATGTAKEESSEFNITLDQLALTHVFALYWAVRILLCEVFADLLPHGGLDMDDQVVRARIDPRQHVRRLIGVIPIFLHPAVGVFRVHLSTFAIGVVARWFRRVERAKGAGGVGIVMDGDDMRDERELFMSYLEREEARGIARFLKGLNETDAGNAR